MSKLITITLTVDAAELAKAIAAELKTLAEVSVVGADVQKDDVVTDDDAAAKAEKAAKAKAAKEAKAKKEAEAAAAAKKADTLAAEEGTEEAHDNVEVSEEDTRKKMADFRNRHGVVETMALVQKYADKFVNVKPADYAALLADMEAKDAALAKKDDLDF